MSRFDGPYHTDVFHVRNQHRQYYYFTQEGRQLSYPSPSMMDDRVLEAAANVFNSINQDETSCDHDKCQQRHN
jgi:hypothetical protein